MNHLAPVLLLALIPALSLGAAHAGPAEAEPLAVTWARRSPELARTLGSAGASGVRVGLDGFDVAPHLAAGALPAARLRVHVGARASDGLSMEVPGAPTVRVSRVAGASASAGALEVGAARFLEAAPGVDALVFATPVGVEDLLVLHGPDAIAAYDVDVPPGFRLVRAARGIVELRDAAGATRLRMVAAKAWDAKGAPVIVDAHVEGSRIVIDAPAAAAWPVAIDPEFTPGGVMTVPRDRHTSTLLPNGRVLLAGGDDLGTAELYDPISGTLSATGSMSGPRFGATAVLLASGKVLVVGGSKKNDDNPVDAPLTTAELYDPSTGAFTLTGKMSEGRWEPAAARLPSGEVLLVGTAPSEKPSTSAELFDEATGSFSTTGALGRPRQDPHAVGLPDGKVLIVGGTETVKGQPDTAEVYDPASGSFTATGPTAAYRTLAVAAPLPSGKALWVGGYGSSKKLPVEIYDPATNAFTSVPSSTDPGEASSATVLPSGQVLLFAALDGSAKLLDPVLQGGASTLSVTKIYNADAADNDPPVATLLPTGDVLASGGADFAPAGARQTVSVLRTTGGGSLNAAQGLSEPRFEHTATVLSTGDVLLTGGISGSIGSGVLASADLYEVATHEVHPVGPMNVARAGHSATLLPDGRVLIVGGDNSGDPELASVITPSAEVYDPTTRTFAMLSNTLATARTEHAAVLLGPPDNAVLITGGLANGTDPPLNSAELFDIASESFQTLSATTTGRRKAHTATLLPSGKVLLGGTATSTDGFWLYQNVGELFDPATRTFEALANWNGKWSLYVDHTATLLPDGDVLLVGDQYGGSRSKVLRFGAATETFTVETTTQSRAGDRTALLPSGLVLDVGGGTADHVASQTSAELIDPVAHTSSPAAGMMLYPRAGHSATWIESLGRVLIAGGGGYLLPSPTALELYDPATQQFSVDIAHSGSPRAFGTLTPLPNGLVLSAGGSLSLSSTDVFDPSAATFAPGPKLAAGHAAHSATLLASGQVLLAGGSSAAIKSTTTDTIADAIAGAELVDSTGMTSTPTGSLVHPRAAHTATLLPSGRVVVAGGLDKEGLVDTIEIYDPKAGAFAAAGKLHAARAWHGAAVLPSGRVLVVGGRTKAAAAATAEIFDPATQTTTTVAAPSLPSRTFALALGSGEVLVAGDGLAYAFTEATAAFTPILSSPAGALGVAPLANGDVAVNAAGGIVRYRPGLHAFDPSSAGSPLTAQGPSIVALPSGEALVVGTDTSDGPLDLLYAPDAPGVQPSLLDAPTHLVPTQDIVMSGARFTTPSAAGSDALGAMTSVPVPYFMPIEGGGPILGAVVSFSDGAITWRLPESVHAGPGRLYVSVDGVASAGRYAVLEGATDANTCAFDGECATGFCSQGVCCDARCAGPCESCRASDQQGKGAKDGTCAPAAAKTNPKGACSADPPGTCGRTGVCDGTSTDCGRDPDGASCGDEGTCQGGACLEPSPPACTPSRDGLIDGNDVKTCEPYLCNAGACLMTCRSNLDCASGYTCDVDARCTRVSAPPATVVPGGCAMSQDDRPGGGLVALAVAAALAGARRRRSRAS